MGVRCVPSCGYDGQRPLWRLWPGTVRTRVCALSFCLNHIRIVPVEDTSRGMNPAQVQQVLPLAGKSVVSLHRFSGAVITTAHAAEAVEPVVGRPPDVVTECVLYMVSARTENDGTKVGIVSGHLLIQQVPSGGLTAWTGTPLQFKLFWALLHTHGLAPCQPVRMRSDCPSGEVHEYMPLSFVDTIS